MHSHNHVVSFLVKEKYPAFLAVVLGTFVSNAKMSGSGKVARLLCHASLAGL